MEIESNNPLESSILETSLVVQWLRRHAPNAGGSGSIPGQGPMIPHATRQGQKKKKNWESLVLEVLNVSRSEETR